MIWSLTHSRRLSPPRKSSILQTNSASYRFEGECWNFHGKYDPSSCNPLARCRTIILTSFALLGVYPLFGTSLCITSMIFVRFLSQRRILHRPIYISISFSLMSLLTSSSSYCLRHIYSLLVVYGTFPRSYYLFEDFFLIFPQSFGYPNTEVRHLLIIHFVNFTYNYLVAISRYLFNITVIWLPKY